MVAHLVDVVDVAIIFNVVSGDIIFDVVYGDNVVDDLSALVQEFYQQLQRRLESKEVCERLKLKLVCWAFNLAVGPF